jgi:hypothetical protein
VEGKMKQTVRNSCRWLKAKFIEARYGWWWWWWCWCMGRGPKASSCDIGTFSGEKL